MKYLISLFLCIFLFYIIWVIWVSDLNTTPWRKQKKNTISINFFHENTLLANWESVKLPNPNQIAQHYGPFNIYYDSPVYNRIPEGYWFSIELNDEDR